MSGVSVYTQIGRILREKNTEPKQRLVGGRFGWAVHRFPIKGGISWVDIMLGARNHLFDRIKLPETSSEGGGASDGPE